MSNNNHRSDPALEVEDIRYIPVPTATPEMFYGPIGQWVQDLAQGSEASPVAMFVNL